MADVLVGSERRVLISGYGLPPPAPESLLCRIDQIDLRLRQLEEQRRPAAHATDDCGIRRAPAQQHHQHTKSLPSALQHVQLKGSLMDRLNLLESRIRQLSCELDLDPAAGGGGIGKAAAGSYYANALGLAGGSSSTSVAPPRPLTEDTAWSESAPILEPCRDLPPVPAPDKPAADGSWAAVEILQTGSRQLHRNKPNPSNKVKTLKEAKCACQKEKRKAESGRTSRRWFMVGC